jgi:hypothetical protein
MRPATERRVEPCRWTRARWCANQFAQLGLLGLVSLFIQPWTGVVLVQVAGTGIAYALLPWETWLPKKE